MLACYPAMLLMEMLLDREPLLNGMMVGFFRAGRTGRGVWSSGGKKVDQGRSRTEVAKSPEQKNKTKQNMNFYAA